MLKKLKRWIVHKLGGMMVSDLPTDMAMQLLNRWTNQAIDKEAVELLNNAIKTQYTNNV